MYGLSTVMALRVMPNKTHDLSGLGHSLECPLQWGHATAPHSLRPPPVATHTRGCASDCFTHALTAPCACASEAAPPAARLLRPPGRGPPPTPPKWCNSPSLTDPLSSRCWFRCAQHRGRPAVGNGGGLRLRDPLPHRSKGAPPRRSALLTSGLRSHLPPSPHSAVLPVWLKWHGTLP